MVVLSWMTDAMLNRPSGPYFQFNGVLDKGKLQYLSECKGRNVQIGNKRDRVKKFGEWSNCSVLPLAELSGISICLLL